MSIHVNFSTHGKEINDALQAVLSDNDATNWLVLAYDKGTNDLRLQDTGGTNLESNNSLFEKLTKFNTRWWSRGT